MIVPYMPGTAPPRPSAHDGTAGGDGRDLLHRAERMPVAASSERVSAIHDGPALFLPVAR